MNFCFNSNKIKIITFPTCFDDNELAAGCNLKENVKIDQR